MEKIIKILSQIKLGVDFIKEDDLIARGILTSFEIIRLINELNHEFNIQIAPSHILPENFQNAQAIHSLVKKLQFED